MSKTCLTCALLDRSTLIHGAWVCPRGLRMPESPACKLYKEQPKGDDNETA